MYHIVVTQKIGEQSMRVTVNGVEQEDEMITLTDDGAEYDAQVLLSTKPFA
jgi:hypothetical protein